MILVKLVFRRVHAAMFNASMTRPALFCGPPSTSRSAEKQSVTNTA